VQHEPDAACRTYGAKELGPLVTLIAWCRWVGYRAPLRCGSGRLDDQRELHPATTVRSVYRAR
jgi:hypothetical protein